MHLCLWVIPIRTIATDLLQVAGPVRHSDHPLKTPVSYPLLPVQVYSYFLGIYKVSVGVGIAGYALLVLEFCGIGAFLRPALAPTACLMLLWYGLYFGVLGRDCAEVAADRMVSLICPSQSPLRTCCVGNTRCSYQYLYKQDITLLA